jgi:hypothetical protein
MSSPIFKADFCSLKMFTVLIVCAYTVLLAAKTNKLKKLIIYLFLLAFTYNVYVSMHTNRIFIHYSTREDRVRAKKK